METPITLPPGVGEAFVGEFPEESVGEFDEQAQSSTASSASVSDAQRKNMQDHAGRTRQSPANPLARSLSERGHALSSRRVLFHAHHSETPFDEVQRALYERELLITLPAHPRKKSEI